MSLSVRAFPTFRFYLEGSQVDETLGPNIQEIESKVRNVPVVTDALHGHDSEKEPDGLRSFSSPSANNYG